MVLALSVAPKCLVSPYSQWPPRLLPCSLLAPSSLHAVLVALLGQPWCLTLPWESHLIKTVRIKFKKVLHTADLDWARFVKDGVLLWPEKLLGGGGFDKVLWILVALEMALRVDVVSFLVFLWLVVWMFWQKTWNFTLGGCAGPGSRATITVIWYGFYFTLGGCWDPVR